MSDIKTDGTLNRRRILGAGAMLAGGLFAGRKLQARPEADENCDHDSDDQPTPHQKSVSEEISDIIQADGMWSNGVFSIEIDRNDIDDVEVHGVPIKPSFEINGTAYFQFDCAGRIMMNGDMALKPNEIDPWIDALIANNIVFQAFHMHLYDFDPMVWFIHYRAFGDPIQIAHGLKNALNTTSTPFPQTMPSNPTTPLPAEEIGKILGASPQISSDGVVNYDVPRRNPMWLGGVRINPFLNVQTPISFEPLDNTGKMAAAVPDFGMLQEEVMPVMRVMRSQGWDVGCLYNQETDERPQLFFSHQFKTGDPIELAKEIRNGLNKMDLKFD